MELKQPTNISCFHYHYDFGLGGFGGYTQAEIHLQLTRANGVQDVGTPFNPLRKDHQHSVALMPKDETYTCLHRRECGNTACKYN